MFKFLKEKKLTIIVVFLILLPLLFLSSSSKPREERAWYDQVIYYLTHPIFASVTYVVEGAFSSYDTYISLVHAKRNNKLLTGEIEELQFKLNQLKEIQLENDRLRELLNFKQRISPFMIPAQVIAKDISTEFETISINKGSSDSVNQVAIQKKMAVVTPQGIVGYIREITPDHSIVLTIIDPGSRVDAIIQRSRARGVAVGVLGGKLRMKYVNRTEDVQIDDLVITSGLGGIFPKGLMIGKVHKVVKKPYGTEQYIEIEPTVDFSKLEEIFVVLGTTTLPEKPPTQ